uniref:Atlastin-1-like n=1 Tax=Phallusia mammillata TaxID=59560 RepID=A0A6F9D7W6_9ASCI|nr:atlastin-1-like [Phallusia mammillata]
MFNGFLPSPRAEKDLVLSLWDTEGLSNPNQTRHHDISILRLSAYFSQVLIYNVKEMISSESMDKIQVFLEEMRTSGKSQTSKFQTLIIVVRDANQQFGYCWEGGGAYLNHIKSQGKPGKQTDVFFRELNDKFRSVLVFMMPPPNQKVKRKSTKITYMRDIEDQLFRESLRIFTRKLLHEIVQPGIVSGDVFRVCDLKPQLKMFAKKFQSREQPTSFTLANAIKEQHMAKEAKTCFQSYQRKLLEAQGWFQTEATRTKRHLELKHKALDNLRASTEGHYMEGRFVNAAIADLDKRLDERFKVYNHKAKKTQRIMWIAVGMIGAYALYWYRLL